jgi:hypothetical protein
MVEKIRSNCFGCYFYKNNVLDASFVKRTVPPTTVRKQTRTRASYSEAELTQVGPTQTCKAKMLVQSFKPYKGHSKC